MIRTGPYGDWFGAEPDGLSLAKLEANPHGIDLGPLAAPPARRARARLAARSSWPPEPIIDDLRPAGRRARRDRRDRDGGLVLVGRRHLRSNNSWMHNVERAGEGQGPLHAAGAPRRRRPRSAWSTAAWPRWRRGSAQSWRPSRSPTPSAPAWSACPTGGATTWPAPRMGVAADHAGVNSNILTDGARARPAVGQRRAQRHPRGRRGRSHLTGTARRLAGARRWPR